jgi:hypothetical protein
MEIELGYVYRSPAVIAADDAALSALAERCERTSACRPARIARHAGHARRTIGTTRRSADLDARPGGRHYAAGGERRRGMV